MTFDPSLDSNSGSKPCTRSMMQLFPELPLQYRLVAIPNPHLSTLRRIRGLYDFPSRREFASAELGQSLAP